MQFLILFIIFFGLALSDIQLTTIKNNDPCLFSSINKNYCDNSTYSNPMTSLKVKGVIGKNDKINIYNKKYNTITLFVKYNDMQKIQLSFPVDIGNIKQNSILNANITKIKDDIFYICGKELYIDNKLYISNKCFIESTIEIINSNQYYNIDFSNKFKEIEFKINKDLIEYI